MQRKRQMKPMSTRCLLEGLGLTIPEVSQGRQIRAYPKNVNPPFFLAEEISQSIDCRSILSSGRESPSNWELWSLSTCCMQPHSIFPSLCAAAVTVASLTSLSHILPLPPSATGNLSCHQIGRSFFPLPTSCESGRKKVFLWCLCADYLRPTNSQCEWLQLNYSNVNQVAEARNHPQHDMGQRLLQPGKFWVG